MFTCLLRRKKFYEKKQKEILLKKKNRKKSSKILVFKIALKKNFNSNISAKGGKHEST